MDDLEVALADVKEEMKLLLSVVPKVKFVLQWVRARTPAEGT